MNQKLSHKGYLLSKVDSWKLIVAVVLAALLFGVAQTQAAVEPETAVGPAMGEVILDRILKFTPKP